MDKVEILTKKLEEVRVKCLGLTPSVRQAIFNAMEEYAGQEGSLTQKFNKRLGKDGANTGLEMVVHERIEMIEKHGKTTEFDVQNNSTGELKQAAIACLTAQADFPPNWNKASTNHIRHEKPEIERLAVAAAFCVAEIDRLLNE